MVRGDMEGTESSHFDHGRGLVLKKAPNFWGTLCQVQILEKGLSTIEGGPKGTVCLNRTRRRRKARDPLSTSVQ